MKKNNRYKVHSIEEQKSISDEEYPSVLAKAISAAKELGIERTDEMELDEVEYWISLRQTPLSEMGRQMVGSDELYDVMTDIRYEVDNKKEEIISQFKKLTSYGYYCQFKIPVKVFDIDGKPLNVVGFSQEGYEEPSLIFDVKGKRIDSQYVYDDIGYNYVVPSDLMIESLLSLAEEVEMGNVIEYSNHEMEEKWRRKLRKKDK